MRAPRVKERTGEVRRFPGLPHYEATMYTGVMATRGASSYERIWDTVARIPAGRVATYGQIAKLAGLGKRARLVGYALHRTPDALHLPWHRVINAKGRISFPRDHPHFDEQRRRLLQEGVEFDGACVDLRRFRWDGDTDDLPEEYLRGV